jgi:hypothetical protein
MYVLHVYMSLQEGGTVTQPFYASNEDQSTKSFHARKYRFIIIKKLQVNAVVSLHDQKLQLRLHSGIAPSLHGDIT